MKKIIYLFMLLMFSLFAFSCNKTQNVNENDVVLNSNETIEPQVPESENGVYKLKVGNKMPEYSWQTNKDSIYNYYNSDKPVFINFWATWCPPCVNEMPDLQEVYDEYKDRVDFIFVNSGESKEIINDFMINEGGDYTFPVGYDPRGESAMALNVISIPTTYILDKNDVVKEIIIGARVAADYKAFIDKVLQ